MNRVWPAWLRRGVPNLSSRSSVQRNTPPNATSSPKTTADGPRSHGPTHTSLRSSTQTQPNGRGRRRTGLVVRSEGDGQGVVERLQHVHLLGRGWPQATRANHSYRKAKIGRSWPSLRFPPGAGQRTVADTLQLRVLKDALRVLKQQSRGRRRGVRRRKPGGRMDLPKRLPSRRKQPQQSEERPLAHGTCEGTRVDEVAG